MTTRETATQECSKATERLTALIAARTPAAHKGDPEAASTVLAAEALIIEMHSD